MEKIRMHKKMAMTGKSPVMKMKSGGMTKKEKMKKYEHPMKEERFQRTRQEAIAKVVGKENVGDPRTKIKGYNSGGMAKAYMKNKSEKAADKIKQVSQEKLMNIKPKDKVKN